MTTKNLPAVKKSNLVEPFKKGNLETIFESQAEFDAARARFKDVNKTLVGETFTQQIQYNYMRPTFWERVQILIFGIPPHEILVPRPVTETELIISSLESEPGAWKMSNSNYCITHRNGVQLWVANEDYGIKHYGTNLTSSFNKTERKLIWDSVQTWQALHNSTVANVWDSKLVAYAKARRIVIAEETK